MPQDTQPVDQGAAANALQPQIDKNNRWRQRILAMEERFVVHSYPQRLFTTVWGVIAVDAFNAWKAKTNIDMDYKEFIRDAALAGMHNTIDEGNAPLDGDAVETTTRTPGAATTPGSGGHDCDHRAVRISSIVGWAGSNRQRCVTCTVPCG